MAICTRHRGWEMGVVRGKPTTDRIRLHPGGTRRTVTHQTQNNKLQKRPNRHRVMHSKRDPRTDLEPETRSSKTRDLFNFFFFSFQESEVLFPPPPSQFGRQLSTTNGNRLYETGAI